MTLMNSAAQNIFFSILLGIQVSAYSIESSLAQPSKPTTEETNSPALDYLYNRSGQDGSAAGTLSDDYRRGKTAASSKQNAADSLSSADSTLLPAFEGYLGQAEVEPERLHAYKESFVRVTRHLSERRTVEAFQHLLILDEFDFDGGISRQIANRVRAVWDTDTTARELLSQNDQLYFKVRLANWNADGHTNSIQRNTDSGSSSKQRPPNQSDGTSNTTGHLRVTEEYFTSLDSKARIKINELKITDIKSKARADLIDYIDTLYKSKKLLHVIIASGFYHALFRDGELPPKVANHATAASVAIRDSAKAVEVFQFRLEQKEVSSASSTLLSAWEVSDSTFEMLALSRALKLKVIAHANRVRKMRNLIEAREFGLLPSLLDEIEETATDYDTTKPRALTRAVHLDSRLRLAKAKLFAQQGDTKRAMDEFKIAAEIWPGNPDLEHASTEYFAMEDTISRSLIEFDRLVAERNFRAIAENQVKYLHAAQSDSFRVAKLKEALSRVYDAQAALTKAKMQQKAGDSFGAWETIEAALGEWNGDQMLNEASVLYSSQVPEFVSAIKRAQTAEEDAEYGASMSLFALARHYYPSSIVSQTGMKRSSTQLISGRENLSQEKVAGSDEKETANGDLNSVLANDAPK